MINRWIHSFSNFPIRLPWLPWPFILMSPSVASNLPGEVPTEVAYMKQDHLKTLGPYFDPWQAAVPLHKGSFRFLIRSIPGDQIHIWHSHFFRTRWQNQRCKHLFSTRTPCCWEDFRVCFHQLVGTKRTLPLWITSPSASRTATMRTWGLWAMRPSEGDTSINYQL